MTQNRRTRKEWLAQYDAWAKNKGKIKGYIRKEDLDKLVKYRKELELFKLIAILNHIWYYVPDNLFNIRENPKGWNEFLQLVEFWDNEELQNVLKI